MTKANREIYCAIAGVDILLIQRTLNICEESGKTRQWSISLNSGHKRLAKTWLCGAVEKYTKTWANKDLHSSFLFDFLFSSFMSTSKLGNFICPFTFGWNIIIGFEHLLSQAYTVTSTTYKVPNFFMLVGTPPPCSTFSFRSPPMLHSFPCEIRKASEVAHYISLYENCPNIQQIFAVDVASTLSHSPLLSNSDGCSICSMRLYLWSMVTNWKLYWSMYTKPLKCISNNEHGIRVSCVLEEKLVEKFSRVVS